MCTKDRWASILMTSGFVLSLCKTISVFCNCFVLLLYFFSQAGYTLNAPASRRIIGYQFTNPHSGKGVYKCIRVRTAPQRCCKGGNSLREFDDARWTHRRSPDGPSYTWSACSAKHRFEWSEQRKVQSLRMLLCQHTERWACCWLQHLEQFRTRRPCSKFG